MNINQILRMDSQGMEIKKNASSFEEYLKI